MKLADIAHLANISKTAASLALNNKPGVSPATRALVLKIAAENHYVPLRKHKKAPSISATPQLQIRFVACTNEDVVPENYETLPFFNKLLSYLATAISAKHYSLITNKLPKDTFLSRLQSLEEEEPSDGIIFLGTNLTAANFVPLSACFPNVVILDSQCSSVNCNAVTMNNYLGAYEAANYLLDLGHQKIGYVKGTPRVNNFYERERGFQDALRRRKIDPNTLPKLHIPGMRISPLENDPAQLLAFARSVSAVFCEDDYIAISLIKTLGKLGVKIPEELSIMGFDDIPEALVTTPELTTIHVPIKEITQAAIAIIEEEAQHPTQVKRQTFINTQLIVRESVKKMN